MNLISVYTYEINDPHGDRIINFTSNHPIPFIIGQMLNPGSDKYDSYENPCIITDIVYHIHPENNSMCTVIWLDEEQENS